MAEGGTEGSARGADGPGGYEIVIVLPRDEGPELASILEADDVMSLPCVAVDGEPDTSSIIAAIAGLLGDDHPPPLRIVPLTGLGVRPGLALVELAPFSGVAGRNRGPQRARRGGC